jgi:hypothetical protein
MLRSGHAQDVQHVPHVIIEGGRRGLRVLEEGRHRVHLDQTALLRQPAQPRVVDVAHVIVQAVGTGMREDDGRLRQFQQLVEHGVGGMRLVDHDAEAVRLGDQRSALRRQPLPLRCRRIRRVGELVVGGVHQPQHAQAVVEIGLQQRRIQCQGRGVLHADEHHAPARGGDAPRILGSQCQFELVRMCGHQAVQLEQPLQPMVARGTIAGDRALTLPRVDHPQAAVEPAFDHARQVDLVGAITGLVAFEDVPQRVVEQHRCVQMAVEHQHALVQRADIGWHGAVGCRQ